MFHEGAWVFPSPFIYSKTSIVKPIVFFFQEEIMKVLFICTGNICRSPMGELLLPQFMPDLESDSADTRGLFRTKSHRTAKGCSTSMASIPAASARNESPRNRAGQRSHPLLRTRAAQGNRGDCTNRGPQNLPHQRFRQHVRLLQGTGGAWGGNTRQEKLESVIDNASMIRPMIPDTNNVEDPIGKDFAVYQAAYNEICKALQTIASATA